ncbi:MAG: Crp/Fnr family transcriptional regulator [Zoogloeaceae bacterium]|nr:Crp/Fnr family transcriptional regulator [Zoogloeaceae bacterium]
MFQSQETDAATLIDSLPVFAAWPAWARALLARSAHMRHYFRGCKIISAGEEVRGFLVILDGVLSSFRHGDDGQHAMLALSMPGDVYALIPVLQGVRSSVDVYAHEHAHILHIAQDSILEVLSRDSRPVVLLLELILKHFADFVAQDPRFTRDPGERLNNLLLRLAERCGKETERGLMIDVRLTQDDLAALCSLSRQTINKEIRKLAEAGLIEKSYNTITLTDITRMRQCSPDCFNTGWPARTPLMEILQLA